MASMSLLMSLLSLEKSSLSSDLACSRLCTELLRSATEAFSDERLVFIAVNVIAVNVNVFLISAICSPKLTCPSSISSWVSCLFKSLTFTVLVLGSAIFVVVVGELSSICPLWNPDLILDFAGYVGDLSGHGR